MLGFEVEINGERVCLAGIEEFGVLTAVLSWVRNRSDVSVENNDLKKVIFQIGGSISVADTTTENVSWLRSTLEVGDELRLKIVDSGKYDAPTERQWRDPMNEIENTKAHYEWLLRQMENEIK